MIYFHRAIALLEYRPDWSLLIGPEELLSEAVFAGGHGGVSGGANVFPKLYVRLYETARDRNVSRARQLHQQVMRISGSLYRIGRHPSAIIKGIKCALSCLGVCDDFMAEPFHRFRADERARVEKELNGLRAELGKLYEKP
jgi:4-hydroxy-tetrahydrodipicolinate synthase